MYEHGGFPMIWMFFIACATKEPASEIEAEPESTTDTGEVVSCVVDCAVDPNIALCEEIRVEFLDYYQELKATIDYTSCSTSDECYHAGPCKKMCGACIGFVSNVEGYSLIMEPLRAYEDENCQACEDYPYPEPEAPYPEPVSEPPSCVEGICE